MNKKMKLSSHIGKKDIEQEAIRAGFGRGLKEAGELYEDVVALCADLTGSTKMDQFRDAFPDRFFEAGIQEQNMVGVAAGMAHMGKIPFVSSYAAFNPGRNFDQIRTTVALNDFAVKIIGSHAGVSVGPDGATHQMLEDIAMMRALPNMVVVAPGDSVEAEKATIALAADPRPTYMRLAREATPVFTTKDTPFSLNKAYVLTEGKDLTIVATGAMTYQALLAADTLFHDGIDAEVIHVPVIKPLDGATILSSLAKTNALITVEEAQINGGLGGAIAEFAGEHHPVPLRRIGVKDRFGESGDPNELLKKFGLNHKAIIKMAHNLFNDLGRQ